MRSLEDSNHREAKLQKLLEETFDQSERVREKTLVEFRQSLKFKALTKGALESSMNMLGSDLLDRGLVKREDLEGLDMNECILSESRSYWFPFFNMSAERMERMFAFVSNMKALSVVPGSIVLGQACRLLFAKGWRNVFVMSVLHGCEGIRFDPAWGHQIVMTPPLKAVYMRYIYSKDTTRQQEKRFLSQSSTVPNGQASIRSGLCFSSKTLRRMLFGMIHLLFDVEAL
ncbi:hypothetical protein AXF42_Ash017823 [Apostasia shenzhenica]|uniref:Uncharacterized protein n=1 Tax=Apostasia shenzhenica TaxID=1088818 RepID=A0A2I0A3W3_9ASPA|nr:hypothetical protein AXF42_Ash017823 [Apostasia shenzhenica]